MATEDGISMLVKPEHLSKAHSPMYVNVEDKTISVNDVQSSKVCLSMRVTEGGISMLLRDPQFRNAASFICVTDEGIETSLNDVQPSNAKHPIVCTVDGIAS